MFKSICIFTNGRLLTSKVASTSTTFLNKTLVGKKCYFFSSYYESQVNSEIIRRPYSKEFFIAQYFATFVFLDNEMH